jgi:hypothetical protein
MSCTQRASCLKFVRLSVGQDVSVCLYWCRCIYVRTVISNATRTVSTTRGCAYTTGQKIALSSVDQFQLEDARILIIEHFDYSFQIFYQCSTVLLNVYTTTTQTACVCLSGLGRKIFIELSWHVAFSDLEMHGL